MEIVASGIDPAVAESIAAKPKLKKIELKFDEGTPEAWLVANTKINSPLLAMNHNMFDLEITDGELHFKLDNQMGRHLYNEDFTEEVVTDISYIDLILSGYNDNSYDVVVRCAESHHALSYIEDDLDSQFNLLCAICKSYFISKFNDIKKLEDITRPVPTQLFINVLMKHKKQAELLYINKEGNEFAGILKNMRVQSNFFSRWIQLELFITSRGKEGYVNGSALFDMPFIPMAQQLSDLGLEEMTPELKEKYTERGRKYVAYTQNPAYLQYNGFAFRPGRFGNIRMNVNGRVMVDISAMRSMNSHLGDGWYMGHPFNNTGCFQEVPAEALWMCSPVVYGFSFTNKDWVQMNLENLTAITFSDTAFKDLIVPEEYKNIFVTCLTNEMPSLDSIEGKGCGKIFLLYGPPGCGKTLSAESVAEYLHKPLYYVSVGELGVSPESLESQLSDIMEVASSWDAVVLLDEVDVFAMKRDGSDIERCAMVAIFLRLLERYNGVMFMTTNLIDNLDPAFISRATACVPYAALGAPEREAIWQGLLRKASKLGVTIADDVYANVDVLSKSELNGREIKNLLRLAYSVALGSKDKILTLRTITSIIGIRPKKD